MHTARLDKVWWAYMFIIVSSAALPQPSLHDGEALSIGDNRIAGAGNRASTRRGISGCRQITCLAIWRQALGPPTCLTLPSPGHDVFDTIERVQETGGHVMDDSSRTAAKATVSS